MQVILLYFTTYLVLGFLHIFVPNKTYFCPVIRIPVIDSESKSVDSRPPYLSLNLFIHTISVPPLVQSIRVMQATDMFPKHNHQFDHLSVVLYLSKIIGSGNSTGSFFGCKCDVSRPKFLHTHHLRVRILFTGTRV